MVLPEKHEDQPVIYNAVRSKARLKFEILKHPGSRKRQVNIELVQPKASSQSSSPAGSPLLRDPDIPTPPSNDVRVYQSVPELAAQLHNLSLIHI